MSGLTTASIVLLAALLPAACAVTPEPRSDPEGTTAKAPLDPGGVVEHAVGNKAVALLWQQAEQARADGDTGAAIRALERAVEVTPGDAVLWSRLAELRLRAGEAGAAESLAARSNSMAPERRLLRFRNWLIIEAARRAQGDEQGADAARAEIERLRAGE